MSSLNTAYSTSILGNVTPYSTFSPNLTQPTVLSTGGNTAQYESIGGPVRGGGGRGGSRRRHRHRGGASKRRSHRRRKTYSLKRHSHHRRR